MQKTFLTARWENLIIANYEVSPELLLPYLPEGVELDIWNGKCLISLVGFMFLETKVKGLSIPFHKNFEEINLRFYVKYFDKETGWKRGTSFIKEIVPRKAISFIANTFYNENYVTMKTSHVWKIDKDFINVEYGCSDLTAHTMKVKAINKITPMRDGSEEEFIAEHYWGYSKQTNSATIEYAVEHPRWNVFPVVDCEINFDFGRLYNSNFSFLSKQLPISVFLAKGSEVKVMDGKRLKKV